MSIMTVPAVRAAWQISIMDWGMCMVLGTDRRNTDITGQGSQCPAGRIHMPAGTGLRSGLSVPGRAPDMAPGLSGDRRPAAVIMEPA